MLKNVLNALADGFGYVIASLVGALVALSFSLPEPIPEWYYIGTITVALAGAVVIALLRRGLDEALPVRIEEENPREGQHDDVGRTEDVGQLTGDGRAWGARRSQGGHGLGGGTSTARAHRCEPSGIAEHFSPPLSAFSRCSDGRSSWLAFSA